MIQSFSETERKLGILESECDREGEPDKTGFYIQGENDFHRMRAEFDNALKRLLIGRN